MELAILFSVISAVWKYFEPYLIDSTVTCIEGISTITFIKGSFLLGENTELGSKFCWGEFLKKKDGID